MSLTIWLVLRLWVICSHMFILANSNDITCSADGLCRSKPIICNDNEDCFIRCDGRDSCWYSIIQCPLHGKCDIWCGLERNTCDAITINATQSTALYMYCADNECDDTTIHCPTQHYIGIDHPCTLEGAKTLDRVLFYTKEGFNDLNIANIGLTESMVICGDQGQYTCTINAAETGCVSTNDNTCETYRLPTPIPTVSPIKTPTNTPTDTPSLSPTISPSDNPVTSIPSDAPTTAPVQIRNNPEDRLEFYIYYNDPNGVNMILGKWMHEELLNTYDEHTGTSHEYSANVYNPNRKWRMGGLVNMTFCVVFNQNYHKRAGTETCQRFTEYEFDLKDPTTFNTQYVAYGTFGIVAHQSVDTFQLFVIDSMTSILFRQTLNANMAQRLRSVGFDYIFQAVAIKVQPLEHTRNSIASVQQVGHDNTINIALGILLGVLAALTCIVIVYCMHYYVRRGIISTKTPEQPKKKTTKGKPEGKMLHRRYHSDAVCDGSTAATEQMNLKIVPRNSETTMTATSLYDHGMIPTKRHSSTGTRKNTRNLMEDDKSIPPGYYLVELQKTYLSSDGDDSSEKLPRIPADTPPSDDKSIISSIISFGRRNKSKSKHKKNESNKPKKHKRSQTIDMGKKRKKKPREPQRKRSLHWGFTDGGDDIRYHRGENGICPSRRVSMATTPNSDAQSWNPRHNKCQTAFTGQYRNDTFPDIKSLEMARKSSYHSFMAANHHAFPAASYHHQAYLPFQSRSYHQSPQVAQRLHAPPPRRFHLDNEQFLEQLSPSMKSIEEMYSSPKSTDGPSNWTGQSNASARLQVTASPPAIVSNNKSPGMKLEAQHEINEVSHTVDVDTNSNVMDDSNSTQTVIVKEENERASNI
eukprot:274669_1